MAAALTAERWQRVKTILAEALERPTREEQTRFVREKCGSDTELLLEVEEFLAQSSSVLDELADETPIAFARERDAAPLIGCRIGAYEIVREIGRGGMGAVYLAKRADGEFEKRVAIKLLKRGTDTDEILGRFRAERRILARLDHPNIARLLDAGTSEDGLPFLVMEYVEGEPITDYARLRHLSIADRLALFLKVCGAVEAAHENHVIHRDLKASNILVRSDGEPKLLDFGIAKLIDVPEDALLVTMTQQRRLTPACASPEQARGKAVTDATDVYALGALLYELLTDLSPHQFSGSNPPEEEITRVICETQPSRPSLIVHDHAIRRQLRGDLDNIVLTALRKEPERRYHSVADLAEDINRHAQGAPIRARPNTATYVAARFIGRRKEPLGALLAIALVALGFLLFYHPAADPRHSGATPNLVSIPGKSIAVLPFKNLSNDTSNSFFVDGMQDQILSDLAQISDLKVVSRKSVMQYRDAARNLKEIGQVLQVTYVLEGAVRRTGSRIHMDAQLLDTRTGAAVWADKYDRDVVDVFAMQRELAEKLVTELKVNLSPRERMVMAERTTNSVEAYDWYLRAKSWAGQYRLDKEGELEAEGFLNKAIERDPNFAQAYCLLSEVELTLYRWFDHSPERLGKAEEAMKTALRLRPDLGEVRLAEAGYYYRTRDFQKARAALATASRLLPNSSQVLTWSAAIDKRQGRWKDALTQVERAVERDPRNAEILHDLINTYADLRRYSDSARLVENGLAAFPKEKLAFLDDKFNIAYAFGDTKTCREIIETLPRGYNPGGHTSMIRFLVAFRDRDWEEAERVIDAAKKLAPEGFITPIPFLYGFMARAQGDQEKARPLFAQARQILEQTVIKRPDDAEPLMWIGLTDAALGHKEEAIREGREGVAKEPVSRDAATGAYFETFLAQIYAWAGEKDLAIEQLKAVVKLPNGPTIGALKESADWDDVRGDPRFAEIVDEAARPIDPIPNGESDAAQGSSALNPPTNDLVAYDLFLRGQALMDDMTTSTDWESDNRRAIDLFERAVTHDPTFALGYAQLCRACVYLYMWTDHSEADLAKAKKAAEEAARLAPTSPDTYVAEGQLADAMDDCSRAFDRFSLAHRSRPEDALILSGLALSKECLGKWDDALRDMEKAKQLAPRNSYMPNYLRRMYAARRDYRNSDRVCDEAIREFANGPIYYRGQKSANALSRGDTEQARTRLAEIPEKFDASGAHSMQFLAISLAERDYDRFKREFAKLSWDHFIDDFKVEAELMRAQVADQEGDHATIESLLPPSREKLARGRLDSGHTNLGAKESRTARLAQIDSYLGRTEDALRESEQAVTKAPFPLDKVKQEIIRAEVLMRAGERDDALDLVERLVTVPYGPSYGELIGPRWDRLRGDPRFERVVEQLAAKANVNRAPIH